MTVPWKQYQTDAATYFATLGLTTKTEASIKGVRTKHKIDVLVSGKYHGIQLKWIVECKYWKTKISKDKVHTLRDILSDVGADKGILLSEIGFQKGAQKAAHLSNITLTSLADLQLNTRKALNEDTAKALQWRLSQLNKNFHLIWRKKKEADLSDIPMFSEKIKIMFLDDAIDEALRGEFPVIYSAQDNIRLSTSNLDELLGIATERISRAEEFVTSELSSK